MVLKDISIAYVKCKECSSSNCVYAYFPGPIDNLSELKPLISKTCDRCKSKISIERIKAKVVTKGLK